MIYVYVYVVSCQDFATDNDQMSHGGLFSEAK
jgi:hypothetical protein